MGYEIKVYQTSLGQNPFEQWFAKLKDVTIKALIVERFERVRRGNLGDSEFVGDGISELRFHYGPGYRLYYAKHETQIILLLCGGAKKTQQKDITLAKKYWLDFQLRSKVHGKNEKNPKNKKNKKVRT